MLSGCHLIIGLWQKVQLSFLTGFILPQNRQGDLLIAGFVILFKGQRELGQVAQAVALVEIVIDTKRGSRTAAFKAGKALKDAVAK